MSSPARRAKLKRLQEIADREREEKRAVAKIRRDRLIKYIEEEMDNGNLAHLLADILLDPQGLLEWNGFGE